MILLCRMHYQTHFQKRIEKRIKREREREKKIFWVMYFVHDNYADIWNYMYQIK